MLTGLREGWSSDVLRSLVPKDAAVVKEVAAYRSVSPSF